MTGQQLARQYYETLGRPALAAHFPALVPRMAVGLAGEGSECFGFDDALSRDHDWGAGFCIWLEEDDFRQYGAQVQAVYDSLPAEKAGFPIRRTNTAPGGSVACARSTGTAVIRGSRKGRKRLPSGGACPRHTSPP